MSYEEHLRAQERKKERKKETTFEKKVFILNPSFHYKKKILCQDQERKKERKKEERK